MLTPERIEAFRSRSVKSSMPFFWQTLKKAENQGYELFLPLDYVDQKCRLEDIQKSEAYAEAIALIKANKMEPFVYHSEVSDLT